MNEHVYIYYAQDVDQRTGEDLNATINQILSREDNKGESLARNPDRPLDSSSSVRDEKGTTRGMTRMTSPEKWEIKQLIAAGVLEQSDYPGNSCFTLASNNLTQLFSEVKAYSCTCMYVQVYIPTRGLSVNTATSGRGDDLFQA